MTLAPIEQYRHQINLHCPLPFSVYDTKGGLLLAIGWVLETDEQMQRLVERSAQVSVEEVRLALEPESGASAAKPRPERMSVAFARLPQTLGRLLVSPLEEKDFQASLDAVATSIETLADRDADQLIFLLMLGHLEPLERYSITHALQCGIACHLVAQRLNWEQSQRRATLRAALTMNLSITALQGQLATQLPAPDDAQRQLIKGHPTQSEQLLRSLGVTEENWLQSVREHHELPDGSGYPASLACRHAPAELLRYVDFLMARSKGRATREPVYPSQTLKELFTSSSGSPIASSIIKEFGLCPPGTYVTLANGSLAVAVRRGETSNAPIVAELADAQGRKRSSRLWRKTAEPTFKITGILNVLQIKTSADPDELYEQVIDAGPGIISQAPIGG